MPNKDVNPFGFFEYDETTQEDTKLYNQFLEHNLETKKWMLSDPKGIKDCSIEVHKPGKGIVNKGLSPETFKKLVEF